MDLFNKLNEYSAIHPEIKPMFYDVVRTITIQVIAQLLFSANNPSVSFFNNTFVQTSLYLCIGVVVFWLLVYKFLVTQNIFSLNI